MVATLPLFSSAATAMIFTAAPKRELMGCRNGVDESSGEPVISGARYHEPKGTERRAQPAKLVWPYATSTSTQRPRNCRWSWSGLGLLVGCVEASHLAHSQIEDHRPILVVGVRIEPCAVAAAGLDGI